AARAGTRRVTPIIDGAGLRPRTWRGAWASFASSARNRDGIRRNMSMTASKSASLFVNRSGGQTPLQSVQQIAADLPDCMKTADALPGEVFLSSALRQLERYGTDAVLDVDVVLVSRSGSPVSEALAKFMSVPELCSHVTTLGRGPLVYTCEHSCGRTLCLHVT